MAMPAFYLERPDKAKEKREKIAVAIILLIISLFIYLSVSDYASMPDPNASECKLGFDKTYCPPGYECKGILAECKETGAEFKYPFTDWFLDKPSCRAVKIYREVCIPESP